MIPSTGAKLLGALLVVRERPSANLARVEQLEHFAMHNRFPGSRAMHWWVLSAGARTRAPMPDELVNYCF
jgi:hypothetical protein